MIDFSSENSPRQVRPVGLDSCHRIRVWGFKSDSPDRLIHLEQDEEPSTTHFGIFDGRILVGCASLVVEPLDLAQSSAKWLRIRAVAIHPFWQGKGYGQNLMREVITQAKARQDEDVSIVGVWLSSLHSQVGFYARLGFEEFGEPYMRPVDGLSQKMVLRLS